MKSFQCFFPSPRILTPPGVWLKSENSKYPKETVAVEEGEKIEKRKGMM